MSDFVKIKHVRIKWPNFEGKVSEFNQNGQKGFDVILPEEVALDLYDSGWNVRKREINNDGDYEYYINVAVSFDKGNPPIIYKIQDGYKQLLSEETACVIDTYHNQGAIEDITVKLRPYPWHKGGRSGIKAYLFRMNIWVTSDDMDEELAGIPDISMR